MSSTAQGMETTPRVYIAPVGLVGILTVSRAAPAKKTVPTGRVSDGPSPGWTPTPAMPIWRATGNGNKWFVPRKNVNDRSTLLLIPLLTAISPWPCGIPCHHRPSTIITGVVFLPVIKALVNPRPTVIHGLLQAHSIASQPGHPGDRVAQANASKKGVVSSI